MNYEYLSAKRLAFWQRLIYRSVLRYEKAEKRKSMPYEMTHAATQIPDFYICRLIFSVNGYRGIEDEVSNCDKSFLYAMALPQRAD